MNVNSKIAIGWASTDITPSKPAKLAGQFFERISEFVHDPITATALAVESIAGDSNKEQLIIVSCDVVSIPKKLQDAVKKTLGIKLPDFESRNLLLNATHTHTAPIIHITTDSIVSELAGLEEISETSMQDGNKEKQLEEEIKDLDKIIGGIEYFEFLTDRIVNTVINAWESRKPGGVSWAMDYALVGHNRRVVYNDGAARMYGSSDTVNFEGLEGASDSGVELLYFWDEEKNLTGVAINVACPSQVIEMKSFISADYWSEVRKEISERYSEDIFILPLCGAAGDESPRDLVRRGRGESNMHELEGMKQIGIRIADAFQRKITYARENINYEVILNHVVEELELPLRQVGIRDMEEAKKQYDKAVEELKNGKQLTARFKEDVLFTPIGILKRYEEQQNVQFYNMELHVIRIGNVAIASNPFELYLDYGFQIKARSKAEQTFVVQLACDCGGYLPTSRAISGGHYGAMVASGKVGPEGARVLVDKTVGIMNEMF